MTEQPTSDALAPVFNTYPPRPGFFSRTFPAMSFYMKMLWAVYQADRVIKAGRGCTAEYIKASQNVARAVNSVGTRVVLENTEALRRVNGPCIIAGNHMSTLETLMLEGIIMPIMPMSIIAKHSLTKYPVFSAPLNACEPIIVGRTSPREDLRIMMTETHERVSRGRCVIVFPQTTRTAQFSPERFNSIGAKLAKRENIPLVPLALKTDFWGCGKIVKDIGKISPNLEVKFRFGEPLDASANEREAHQKCIDFITATLAEWSEK